MLLLYSIPVLSLVQLLGTVSIPVVIAVVGTLYAQQRAQDDALQAYLDHMTDLLTDEQRPLHKTPPDDSRRTVARARTLTVLPRLDGTRKARVVQFLYESNLISKDNNVLSLDGADLSGAVLSMAKVRGADLRRTNLSGAVLSNADLRQADLRGAVLASAKCRWVKLDAADLSGSNLERAELEAGYLLGAKLSGANLDRANLRAAMVTERQLDKSYSRMEATMPDGRKYKGFTVAFEDRPAKDSPPTSIEIGLTDRECESWLRDYKDFTGWHKSRTREDEGENSSPV